MIGNSFDVFTGHLGEFGKAKNCLSKRWTLVIPNQENVNNEHYDTAFENYDIMSKVYYSV